MGKRFSFKSFLLMVVFRRKKAFIDGNEFYNSEYYALLEDRKGNHYPVPKASKWVQKIYGVFKKRGWIERVRGINFFWSCPTCGTQSYFSLRGNWCRHCGAEFDENGENIGVWWEAKPNKLREIDIGTQTTINDFTGEEVLG